MKSSRTFTFSFPLYITCINIYIYFKENYCQSKEQFSISTKLSHNVFKARIYFLFLHNMSRRASFRLEVIQY